MTFAPTSLEACIGHGFDEIIDVRSPAEFAEDHVHGAINLPVLDNEERARIGTIYKQDSPFRARKEGAALISRNIAHHLETRLAERPKGWRPLVYCWRGGQRSGAFSIVLQQIGWRVETLEGGYKTWRRLVHERLYLAPFPAPVMLLDGNTGTAKTEILRRLAATGAAQVLDLEGLACHRGSLFGDLAQGQPSQKGFESALALAVLGLNPDAPVLVEAESRKIGALAVPPALWNRMEVAPRTVLRAPMSARAAYLVDTYADIVADADRLQTLIARLSPYHSRTSLDGWRELARSSAFEALAASLMEEHYDPLYGRQRPANPSPPPTVIALEGLTRDKLAAAAERIAKHLRTFSNDSELN